MLKKYRVRIFLKGAVIFFGLACFTLPAASAQQNPEVYKVQANNDVQVAQQLVNQAQAMLQGGQVSRESLQVAMRLYTQAGQLFEKAGNVYKALGPSYAPPQDVEGAFKAMQHCVSMIEEIKKRI